MKSKLVLTLAAVATFASTTAYSTVVVSQSASGLTAASPYAATFGGGVLAIETATKIAADANSVGVTVNGLSTTTGLLQTFQGNGQSLEGFAFFSPGVNNPTIGSYTISLLDYGTTGPIDTSSEMNGSTTSLFADSFTFPNTLTRQYYFDFQDSSIVTLASDHYYGIDMQFSNVGGSGNINATRTVSDAVATGALGTGAIGAFSANSTRDFAFAIYTTPVPEPSTFAIAIGGGLGLLLMLRRR